MGQGPDGGLAKRSDRLAQVAWPKSGCLGVLMLAARCGLRGLCQLDS